MVIQILFNISSSVKRLFEPNAQIIEQYDIPGFQSPTRSPFAGAACLRSKPA